MSRTALADGTTVRWTPDRGHRSRRTVPLSQVLTPLAVALPVGLLGARGIGWSAAVPIAGVTAVVTLVVLLLWRVTVPRMVSVTATPERIVYRRYGRTSTLERNANLRAAVRTIDLNHDQKVPYLVLAGDGDSFLLNLAMWADADVEDIAATVPRDQRDPEPADTTIAQVRREFPGAMPFYTAHQNWAAVLILLVAVPVVAAAMALPALLADDGDEDPADEPTRSAPRAADLTARAARAQNRLRDTATRALGGTWDLQEPAAVDCSTGRGGYQRILTSTNRSPGAYDQDDRERVQAAARAGGLEDDDVRIDGDSVTYLAYGDDGTGANLVVRVSEGVAVLTTASECSGTR